MKVVGGKRYVHRTALNELSQADLRLVKQAERLARGFSWSVVRVSKDEVMLGRTTPFTQPHPRLIESRLFRGRPLRKVSQRVYGSNAPIYHRIELMLPAHRRAQFAAHTERQQAQGLLSRPDIGTVEAWKRVSGSARVASGSEILPALQLPPGPWPRYYASGANSPGTMSAMRDARHALGVSLHNCGRDTCLAWIERNGENEDVLLFVDSGAFHEFTHNAPISEREWVQRLKIMKEIGTLLGPRALIVLPDKVGDAKTSLRRIRDNRNLVREILKTGAEVILPIQLGIPPKQYVKSVAEILRVDPRRFVPGLPLNAKALSLKGAVDIVRALRPRRVHLLGKGPSRSKPFIDKFHKLDPGLKVSLDSVWMRGVAGMTGGKGKGPLPLTRARYQEALNVSSVDSDSEFIPEPAGWWDIGTFVYLVGGGPRTVQKTKKAQAIKVLAAHLQTSHQRQVSGRKGKSGKPSAKDLATRVVEQKMTVDQLADVLGVPEWMVWGELQGLAYERAVSSKRTVPHRPSIFSTQVTRRAVYRTLTGTPYDLDVQTDEFLAEGAYVVPISEDPWSLEKLETQLTGWVRFFVPSLTPYGVGQIIRSVLWTMWDRSVVDPYLASKPISIGLLTKKVTNIAKAVGSAPNHPRWLLQRAEEAKRQRT